MLRKIRIFRNCPLPRRTTSHHLHLHHPLTLSKNRRKVEERKQSARLSVDWHVARRRSIIKHRVTCVGRARKHRQVFAPLFSSSFPFLSFFFLATNARALASVARIFNGDEACVYIRIYTYVYIHAAISMRYFQPWLRFDISRSGSPTVDPEPRRWV